MAPTGARAGSNPNVGRTPRRLAVATSYSRTRAANATELIRSAVPHEEPFVASRLTAMLFARSTVSGWSGCEV
jgi:hypothetical protein